MEVDRRHYSNSEITEIIGNIYRPPGGEGGFRDLSPEAWLEGGEIIFKQARERGLPISCAFADADSLKALNDRIGHAAGDELLRTIDSSIRQSDFVVYSARVGGDEWKILGLTDEAGAKKIKQRIKVNTQDYVTAKGGYPGLGVGVSVGIATPLPESEESLSALLERADTDLRADKRNNLPVFNRKQRLAVSLSSVALRLANVHPRQFAKYEDLK